MTTEIRGKCPYCGGQEILLDSEAKNYVGATCASCGRVFTEADVEKILDKAGKDFIEDALRKAGLLKS